MNSHNLYAPPLAPRRETRYTTGTCETDVLFKQFVSSFLSLSFGVVPGSLATKTEHDTITLTGKSRLFWASLVSGEGTTPRYAGFVIYNKEAAKADKALAAPSQSERGSP